MCARLNMAATLPHTGMWRSLLTGREAINNQYPAELQLLSSDPVTAQTMEVGLFSP